jgi:TolA-binding protein
MWRQFYEWVRQVTALTDATQTNAEDIARLSEQIETLTHAVEHLAHEVHHSQENERHEREKLELRLENALLRSGQGLPSSEDQIKPAA